MARSSSIPVRLQRRTGRDEDVYNFKLRHYLAASAIDIEIKAVAEEIERLSAELRDTTMGIRMLLNRPGFAGDGIPSPEPCLWRGIIGNQRGRGLP